jgi:Protein of unknown function (DUF4232)
MRVPSPHVVAVMAAVAAALAGASAPARAADPAPAATASPPCMPADLTLREVSSTAGALPAAVYALHNHGASACRIAGALDIRLFDAQGKPIRLRIGPNSTAPALFVLGAGDDASFTITYGRTGTSQCAAAARIDIYLPGQSIALSAPATFTGCAFPSVRISPLRAGAPSPAPSAAPSPVPFPMSGLVT